MKRENRIVEVIIGPVAPRSHRQDARDEKTDTVMTRSESKLGPPDPREEEETKSEKRRGDKKRWNGSRNASVNTHVNVSVKHKDNGSWRRLVNRKGWLMDGVSRDGNRSCSKREIVYAT